MDEKTKEAMLCLCRAIEALTSACWRDIGVRGAQEIVNETMAVRELVEPSKRLEEGGA